jgi:hypothetical protein
MSPTSLASPTDSGRAGRHCRLTIGEGHRQVKTEIRGDERQDLALDLRPAGLPDPGKHEISLFERFAL